MSKGPIVAYSDEQCVYDKDVADRLMSIGDELGLAPQSAVLGAFESDPHSTRKQAACRRKRVCSVLPTLSTHGYEVIAREADPGDDKVLAEFLRTYTC